MAELKTNKVTVRERREVSEGYMVENPKKF
jgi:hypothetical protein